MSGSCPKTRSIIRLYYMWDEISDIASPCDLVVARKTMFAPATVVSAYLLSSQYEVVVQVVLQVVYIFTFLRRILVSS